MTGRGHRRSPIDLLRAAVRRVPSGIKRPVAVVAERLPEPARRAIGASLGREPWHVRGRAGTTPWYPELRVRSGEHARSCLVCGWSGDEFLDPGHVEFAKCPTCDSIARDRFLLWCLFSRHRPAASLRLLETSPRLDRRYRKVMQQWFDYRASDFDQSAHRARLQIDVQNIDLPDASLDVVLCAHVLEHVPDPEAALFELRRVLVPGGRLLLQVPVQQPSTCVPSEPEYHDDDTLVHWRFGYDLTDKIRAGGFDVTVLVPEDWIRTVADSSRPSALDGEFDVDGLRAATRPGELVAALDVAMSERQGFAPAHQFLVWECVRPADE